MEPLVYIMAVMGCADGAQLCEPVPSASGRYESKTACLAAVQDTLLAATDLPYPVVTAQCETRGVQTASASGRKRG